MKMIDNHNPRGVKYRAMKCQWTYLLFAALLGLAGCSNSPYPYASDEDGVVYYTAVSEPPKSLDPQKAYNVRDGMFVSLVYEGLFAYDYLARPVTMIPQLAKKIPEPVVINDSTGGIESVTYSFELQEGVHFIDDPCFPNGKGREMKATDFEFAFKRLTDPKTQCPIAVNFMRIKGLADYRKRLLAVYETAKEEGGEDAPKLDQVIAINKAGSIEGIQLTGPYSFDLVMTEPYPQMLYWLAMNFVSAIPHEAVSYYNPENPPERGDIHHRSEPMEFTLRPVGTGAFGFDWTRYNREARIVLQKNPTWWGLSTKAPSTTFPEQPSCPEDVELGCWRAEDAGKHLPFIDQIEFHLEPESLPRFNKFLQGYYDRSGVPIAGFSQAIANDGLTPDMQELGIRLVKEIDIGVRYMLFNMDDDVIGMPSKFSDPALEANREEELVRRRKLRQALSLAVDMQEFHEKFYNGLGGLAQSPVPPGVFGFDPEYKNPYRQFDPSLTQAKQLLEEAGFEGGIDEKTGKRVSLNIPTSATAPPGTLYFEFYKDAWAKLGVELNIESSDYNTFMDKVHKKDAGYQALNWGWMMDYPDPENFLFLLYGPNSGKYSDNNVNYARYESPRYDELFEAMETMGNDQSKSVTYTDSKSGETKTETLTRMQIIEKMRSVIEEDVPWIPTTHDEAYILSHSWIKNVKQHPVTGPWSKFYHIDTETRDKLRLEWNRPILWPAFLLLGGFILFLIPAILSMLKERR